jgi:hypothetical protein
MRLDAVPRDKTQGEDADEHAGADNPHLVAEGDGGDDVVDAEAEVHQLDRGDGGPEAARGHFADGGDGLAIGAGFFGGGLGGIGCRRLVPRSEVMRHQVDEVGRAEQLQPGILDDVLREKQGEPTEDIRTDDANAEGPVFLLAGQVRGHRGDGEGVVDGEKALDDDQGDDHRDGFEDHLADFGTENFGKHETRRMPPDERFRKV